MNMGWAIIWFAGIVLITIGVIGLVLNWIANGMCKDKCEEINALGHYTIHSGNWKIDDTCICFIGEGIKSFKLGEDGNHNR